MAILDDVLSQISSAIGPRGVDPDDANMGLSGVRLRRGAGFGPANPASTSSTGGFGNRMPAPAATPDDRFSPQRHAAEYPDPHQATHHLRDVNGPGAIAGTVKTEGAGTAVSSPYGAPPPTPGNEATGGAASMVPAAPAAPVTPVTPTNPTAGSLLRVPQYQPPDMAKRAELERERTAAMAPTDPKAAGIRPSIGRRILAGVLGTAAGFGTRGETDAGQVARSIIGKNFNAAERARQAKLSGITQQISDFDTEANEQEKNFEESLKQSKEARDISESQNLPSGPRVIGPNGKEGYYTSSGKFVEGAPTAAESKPDAGDKLDDTFDSRTREANKLGLKGAARTRFIATGRVDSDRTPAQGENEYRDWVAQWKKEHNGQAPSAQAIQRYKAGLDPDTGSPVKPPQEKRGTPAQFAKVEGDKKKALDQAEKDFSDNMAMVRAIKDPASRAAREQEAKDALQKAKDAAQEAYEQQIVSLGGSVSGKPNQPQGGPQDAAASKKVAGPAQGDVESAKKRVPQGRVLVWKDGKFGTVPANQADMAAGQQYKVFR